MQKPQRIATLDFDATVIHSSKRSAKRAHDGERGYQPVLVPWAEQDVIVAGDFRDGNVPTGMRNLRGSRRLAAPRPCNAALSDGTIGLPISITVVPITRYAHREPLDFL